MAEGQIALAEQFDDVEQQKEAATLGMWTFLATEILFFGGMFLSYILYRHAYPAAFAQASRHTILLYGTFNTAVLLTSSLTMASVKFRSRPPELGQPLPMPCGATKIAPLFDFLCSP